VDTPILTLDEAAVTHAVQTLCAAGWREVEMVVVLDLKRTWRTVLMAPEVVS